MSRHRNELSVTVLAASTLLFVSASEAAPERLRRALLVQEMAFSPDGGGLYTDGLWAKRNPREGNLWDASGSTPSLNFWDGRTGRWRHVRAGYSANRIRAGASRGRPVVVVTHSSEVRVFDGRNAKLLKSFRPPETRERGDGGLLRGWDISPDGETILFTVEKQYQSYGFLWKWKSGRPPKRFYTDLSVPARFQGDVTFATNGRDPLFTERISNTLDGRGPLKLRVSRWELPRFALRRNHVTLPSGFFPQLTAFSNNRSLLAVAGDLRGRERGASPYGDPVRRQFVLLWNVAKKQGRLIRCARGSGRVGVSFSHDDTRLAVAEAGRVRVLDLKTGRTVRSIYARRHGYMAFITCAFSPDGSRLAVAGLGPRKIAIFKLNGGRKYLPRP